MVCCAQSKQVLDYLKSSNHYGSLGDSLQLSLHGDFILTSGDTVNNMALAKIVQEHKEG